MFATATGELTNADVRMNNAKGWTVNAGSGCSNKFDIEAVMTHERGHTCGLGHIVGSQHEFLTMYEVVPVCKTYQRTLGLGDWEELDLNY